MKKLTYSALLLLFISAMTLSCKKDEDDKGNPNPLEVGMEELLNRIGYEVYNEDPTDSYEIGFTFSSSKAGKISKLGLKLPENGSYEVSLWDDSTKVKLDSVMVNNTDSSKFNYASITPRSIVADKKYVVSVNTTNKDYFCSDGNLTGLFPFTKGSLTFYNQVEASVNTTTFPSGGNRTSSYCGIASFVFQADEE